MGKEGRHEGGVEVSNSHMTFSERDLEILRGRSALVTGASSGIGRVVAKRLATAGLRVHACARRRELLDELAEELRGTDLHVYTTDLRIEESIMRMFERIEGMGGVDIMLNIAGYGISDMGSSISLALGSTESWRELLELNVLAPCICSREALKSMLARRSPGHIINISSLAGLRPLPTLYPATKSALTAISQSLRIELGKNKKMLGDLAHRIRVSTISPGMVQSDSRYSKIKREGGIGDDAIADAILYTLVQPEHVQIRDLVVSPTSEWK
jgi:NAD(P)-dependent dehydrogenase (short-subunit alcohol dehydrogenase family)